MRPATIALTLLAALSLAVLPGAAQEASPDATPAAACVAPPLPPGTPTPLEGTPAPVEATPTHDMAGMAGTPEVAETDAGAASPEASPTRPAGTPADEATTQRVADAYEGALACLNAGDYLGFAAYFTPEGLSEEFGTANPYDIPAVIEGFGGAPPARLVEVNEVLVLEDGRLYADVVYLWANQLNREAAILVERDGHLLFDAGIEELPVEIPADAQVAQAELVDFGYNLSQTSFAAGAPVAFEVVNNGAYPHQMVVFRLPEGVTLGQVLVDEAVQEQLIYAGDTFAEPGQQGPSLVLVDLAPGTYVAVCFVEEPDGIPHIERGMVVEFTVG